MLDIAILSASQQCLSHAKRLAEKLNLPVVDKPNTRFTLNVNEQAVSLAVHEHNAPDPIWVDFVGGQARHRREYGGGKGQLIAKAVGLKKFHNPTVLDVTAGLGKDAYVLACLGCVVTMVERSNIVATLLDDGLARLKKDSISADILLNLVQADAIDYLSTLPTENYPDVIYLDPMFPERSKSALVKKEMRILKEIVGEDLDADRLLDAALGKAKHRVVVKRPKLAPPINGPDPNVVYSGKTSRYDVYT